MTEITLVSLLSTLAKVFPLTKPEGEALPCILYQRIDTQQNNSHTEKSLSKPRFQITCLAETYAGARELAELVKEKLDLNKEDFELALLINEYDGKEREENLEKVILDFFIFE